MFYSKLSLGAFGRFWPNKAGVLAVLLLALVFGVGTVSSSSLVIPTISISSVQAGQTVTIQTHNFPPNTTFNVTMGKMFTQGIGGISVGQIQSGSGGGLTATFTIPDAL